VSGRLSIPPGIRRLALVLVVFIAVAVVMALTASFWINWWWFGSVGYRDSLVTRYGAEVVYTVLGALVCGGFFALNLAAAMRRTRDRAATGRVSRFANRLLLILLVAGTVVVGAGFGWAIGRRWEMWQLARFVKDYGIEDPVFDRDISFYLLRLPALSSVLDMLILLTLLTLAGAAVVYGVRLGVRLNRLDQTPNQMRVHLLALAGLVVILVGLRYVIANYQLVYSTRGASFGAGFTDVNVQRWVNYLLLVISLIVGGLLLVNAFVQRVKPLLAAIAAWAVVSLVVGVFLPGLVQKVFVEPSELQRERPYIENTIAMTREGFDIDEVTERELSGTAPLEASALVQYPETLNNIRLWDYRIILTGFQQLQSFVPYYEFLDADIDRYEVEGAIRQVLVSARELDIGGLPSGSQTWTNRHLVFTHGYGAVVSPVSEATPQGLPIFLVQRIPPEGEPPFVIERPEIYFGESDMDWVAIHSNQPAFSGEIAFEPGADTGYVYVGEGRGSVGVGGFIGKTLLAIHLRDQNVFFTDQFNDDTRVLLRQQLEERITSIAPFLTLDPDPYLVMSEGRLFWIVDAYTTSDRFPHGARVDDVSYIRNSVKVLVDAYNGTVDFYRTATGDPVADAYNRTYGDIFRPIDEAPSGIVAHFRYPERMYELQSAAYAAFHVDDPVAFYNGEDKWAVPEEVIGEQRGQMAPYYVTMTLPGESEPSYALIRPFVPGGNTDRQNMTAWMAGTADATGLNALVVYRFPRQETVFGPSQVSARIDQEPEISAQISLWNQSGSEVIRGNLLVIPVGESVLYVQPLYLQARGSAGSLPEMRRVIVASSERVVMRPTLEQALIAVFETGAPATAETDVPASTAPGADASLEELAAQAAEAFARGQEAFASGDWERFGEAQAELESILAQMTRDEGQEAPAEGTPAPAAPMAEA
jgi:uncharacterized membrane protein (UPF0182 family)